MLVRLDILKQIEEIIEKAYTDFTYRLLGEDFLTDAQKTQVEALGLIIGRRPLVELLYILARHIQAPNYKKDKGLNQLLDEISRTQVLSTIRDTDNYTLEHAKASIYESIQLSKNELKKQVNAEILKVNNQFKSRKVLTQVENPIENEAKVEKEKNKLLTGLTYAAVGVAAYKLFRKDFTSAMTQLVNETAVDQFTNRMLNTISSSENNQEENPSDPLVYKQVVPDNRLSPECRQLHTNPDWSPRLYRLSELVANGTNVGRPKSAWKAVIGPTHPNCRCTLQMAKTDRRNPK